MFGLALNIVLYYGLLSTMYILDRLNQSNTNSYVFLPTNKEQKLKN